MPYMRTPPPVEAPDLEPIAICGMGTRLISLLPFILFLNLIQSYRMPPSWRRRFPIVPLGYAHEKEIWQL